MEVGGERWLIGLVGEVGRPRRGSGHKIPLVRGDVKLDNFIIIIPGLVWQRGGRGVTVVTVGKHDSHESVKGSGIWVTQRARGWGLRCQGASDTHTLVIGRLVGEHDGGDL